MTTDAPDPQITAHAKERWHKRASTDRFGADLRAIFATALPVGLPPRYEDKGVLHPPTGTILIYKGSYTDRPVVVTVLVAAWVNDLHDDHLERCRGCGWRYDPGDGACPWCADD